MQSSHVAGRIQEIREKPEETVIMKRSLIPLILCGVISLSPAAVVQFDLSPPGTDVAVGLSPSNEVPAAVGSTGSGNETLTGVSLDTASSRLTFNIGYGSAFGFTDLTGPATLAHIHGPAPAGAMADVLIDLAGFHAPAADPAKGGLISGSAVLTPANVSNLLAGFLYVNVHTATNPLGEIRGQLIPVTNNAPRVTCPVPATVECTSSNGAVATVSVTVADQDNESLQVLWVVNGIPVQTNSLAAGMTFTNNIVSLTAEFGLGSNDVAVSVTDGVTVVTCSTVIEVVDTTPPMIVGITATPNRLWPPNHRLVPVTVNVQASDACGPVACRITGVTSDQPVNGQGDGNTSPDWTITGDLTVQVRAERSGRIKRGRTYTVSIDCSDLSGNTSAGTVTVFVPHDQGGRKLDRDWKVVQPPSNNHPPNNHPAQNNSPQSHPDKKPKKNGKK
jgi:hypothetical protein